jgi:hypothetical protein
MYRYFHGSDRNSIPSGLPSRLVDPTLRVLGEQPQFLRIGEGSHPRNELLRKVYQQPSKDVVRTKVLGELFPPTETNPYFSRPDNIAAIRKASEELGIPLERTGLRIATYPLRIEGDVADVNLLAKITNKAASNLNQAGRPVLANALTRKAKFFNQPTIYSELAVDGTEGVEAILEAYDKAEPRRTASSQGNRPILMQADGLDPNIGIPSGSPENIPPMDIEGMRGANRFVDVSQGAQTARVIQYPGTSERLGLLAQQKGLRLQGEGVTNLEDLIRADKARGIGVNPVVTPTIPYAADMPTGQEFILSPKVSIETKRPRFIDLGHGIYTRSGELINAEQKNLIDMGMADLEDRSFILQPQERAMASPLPVEYFFSKDDWAESKGLPIGSIIGNQEPVRALASRLPVNYYGVERDIPTGVDAIIRGFGRRNPKTGLLEGNVNAQGYLQTDLPANYYGIPRDIPTSLRADYGRTGRRGLTPTRDELPLTGEIGSVVGSQLNTEQYRPTTRLGMQVLGLNAQFGRETITPAVVKGDVLYPSNTTIVQRTTPINRLTDDLSSRVLSGEVDLRNYEPFKSNRNTYGAREGKTPWREYYSDPFVYEDKGLDGEVNRLMRAINEAPAQLENALTQQALANQKAIAASEKLKMLGQHTSVRHGLLPQGEGVVNLAREVRKDRRMAEVEAAKAADTIAQLKAAQELMGVEYMVKPKTFSPEVLQGYRMASQNKGAIKNQEILDYPTDRLIDPVDYEKAMTDMGFVGSRDLWRSEPDRDYDIATLFGFTGNY